ncbi:Uncharacterized protein TCM_008814 [Theobroma cacao]|uniref:Integrase catalytic domain-containing protein n=1 Tax=Theobroma cacao TaxID=3641 RepID=A0A061E666_THECC|nr:Uncharacterized protein TCM_008814 [Theobroma cacao]
MDYTKTCLIFQQNKVERQKQTEMLKPLPVLTRPWESISLDFIVRLPKVGDMALILMKELKLFRLKLNISSNYHPQTDGQMEHFNGLLDEYLRHFIQANQKY